MTETAEKSSMKVIWEIALAGGLLKYNLIEQDEIIEFETYKTYGISIISNLFDKREESCVQSITNEREEAENLFKTIVDNMVMPWLLRDIVEDFIGD